MDGHDEDHQYMRMAIELAHQAAFADEVPVGALIVRQGTLLGQGFNQNVGMCDPTAHAEMLALREAGTYTHNHRLPGSTLYVNLEPCPMCFAAIMQARIDRLVYAAPDPKGGFSRFFSEGLMPMFHHHITVVQGPFQEENVALIRSFFQAKRERGKRKWLRQT